jgi:hypothetical protein
VPTTQNIERVVQITRSSRAQQGYVERVVWYVIDGGKRIGPFTRKRDAQAHSTR